MNEKYKPMSLININENILNKTLALKSSNALNKSGKSGNIKGVCLLEISYCNSLH